MDQEYWQGKKGQNYTGGDYNKYLEGKRHGGGSGGGMGCLIVIGILLLLCFVIPAMAAALSAVVFSVVLYFFKAQRFKFTDFFYPAFFGALAYYISGIIAFYVLYHGIVDTVGDRISLYGANALMKTVVLSMVAAVPISVAVLNIRLNKHADKSIVSGFVFSALILLAITLVVGYWFASEFARMFPASAADWVK